VVSILAVVLLLGCGKSRPVAERHQALGAPPDLPIFHEVYVFMDLATESKGTVADTGVFAQGSWVASAWGGRVVHDDNASMVRCNRPNQARGVSDAVCEVFYASAHGSLPGGVIWHDSFDVERWERDEIETKPSSETFLKALAGAPPCLQFRIRIDREAREVTAIGSPIPAGCSGRAANKAVLRLYQRAGMPTPKE